MKICFPSLSSMKMRCFVACKVFLKIILIEQIMSSSLISYFDSHFPTQAIIYHFEDLINGILNGDVPSIQHQDRIEGCFYSAREWDLLKIIYCPYSHVLFLN